MILSKQAQDLPRTEVVEISKDYWRGICRSFKKFGKKNYLELISKF